MNSPNRLSYSGPGIPRRSFEMTKKITVNLITCRTIQQGVGMEAGKTSKKYFDAASIIHMHEEDMKKLGIYANTNVRVTSKDGTIVVKAVRTREDLVPGLAHLPMGPWANAIVSAYTYSTGEPCFKGFPVDIEPAETEKVMEAVELVQTLCPGTDRKPPVRQ
jgi:formylmethanofuran dehydrogenase subunit D